jgi:hypothetical protein
MKLNNLLVGAVGVCAMLATGAQAREPGVLPAFPPGNSLGVPVAAQVPPGLMFMATSLKFERSFKL